MIDTPCRIARLQSRLCGRLPRRPGSYYLGVAPSDTTISIHMEFSLGDPLADAGRWSVVGDGIES